MEKHTAEELKELIEKSHGVYPDKLTHGALVEAGLDYYVALIPSDQDIKVRYFGNLLVQMCFNRKSASPLSVELHNIAGALSYLLNSSSFIDDKYHSFDKKEINRKLRREIK